MYKKNWIIIICICTIFAFVTAVGFTEKKELEQNNINLTIPEVAGLQGGYLPKNEIVIGNYKFECIQIFSDEKKVKEVFFEIKEKRNKKIKLFKCKNFIVQSNKIVIKPTTTTIGNISFKGSFLPVENGDYLGTSENNIVVLRGKFIIKNERKSLYINNNQEFTFLYGD
jgi:hypothetical protein